MPIFSVKQLLDDCVCLTRLLLYRSLDEERTSTPLNAKGSPHNLCYDNPYANKNGKNFDRAFYAFVAWNTFTPHQRYEYYNRSHSKLPLAHFINLSHKSHQQKLVRLSLLLSLCDRSPPFCIRSSTLPFP